MSFPFTELADDEIYEVCRNMSVPTLTQFIQTNKRMKEICSSILYSKKKELLAQALYLLYFTLTESDEEYIFLESKPLQILAVITVITRYPYSAPSFDANDFIAFVQRSLTQPIDMIVHLESDITWTLQNLSIFQYVPFEKSAVYSPSQDLQLKLGDTYFIHYDEKLDTISKFVISIYQLLRKRTSQISITGEEEIYRGLLESPALDELVKLLRI